MYYPDTTSHWMVRQPYTLGKMRLEHQSERSLRLYPIDLRPQIGAQGWIIHLFEEHVQLVSHSRWIPRTSLGS